MRERKEVQEVLRPVTPLVNLSALLLFFGARKLLLMWDNR
jgi:hypothetical protein